MTVQVITHNTTPQNGSADEAFTGIEDSRIRENPPQADTNFGSDAVFQFRSFDVTDHTFGLLRADLSNVPAAATINAASIYVFKSAAEDVSAFTFRINRFLRAWVVGEVTWNVYSSGNSWTTAGGQGSGTDIDGTSTDTSVPGIDGTGWYQFDITADIQDHVDGGDSAANGWLFWPDVLTDFYDNVCVSSDGADGSRPEVWIDYTAGGPIEDDVSEGAEAGDSVSGDTSVLRDVTAGAEGGDAVSVQVRHRAAVAESADAGDATALTARALVSITEAVDAGVVEAGAAQVAGSVVEAAEASDTLTFPRAVIPALASQVPGGVISVALEGFEGTGYTVVLDDVDASGFVANKAVDGFDLLIPSATDDFVAEGAFALTPWDVPVVLAVTESAETVQANVTVDPPDVDGPVYYWFQASGVPEPSGPKDPQSVLPQGTENGDDVRLRVLSGVLDDEQPYLPNGHLNWEDAGRVMVTVYFQDPGAWSPHLFYVYPKNVTVTEAGYAEDTPDGGAGQLVSVSEAAEGAAAAAVQGAFPVLVAEASNGAEALVALAGLPGSVEEAATADGAESVQVALQAAVLEAGEGAVALSGRGVFAVSDGEAASAASVLAALAQIPAPLVEAAEGGGAPSVQSAVQGTVLEAAQSAGVESVVMTAQLTVGGAAEAGSAVVHVGDLDVSVSEGAQAGEQVIAGARFAITRLESADSGFAASVQAALQVMVAEAALGSLVLVAQQSLDRSVSEGAEAGSSVVRDRAVEAVSLTEGAGAGASQAAVRRAVAAATEAILGDAVVYALARSGVSAAEGATATVEISAATDSEQFVLTGELRIESATPVIRITSIKTQL